jgi:hypothetical protein
MILTIPYNSYNKHFIILNTPVKNIMMEYSSFIRIYYSTHNITFNGIFLPLKSLDIGFIEKDVLSTYSTHKTPVFILEKQWLKNQNASILKISGIWENETNYGLVFKFIT